MPVPLPQRYNLDCEPVPTEPPGPASWEGLESLYLQWCLEKPDTLRCHPSVYSTFMSALPPARMAYRMLMEGDPKRVYGIEIVMDGWMAPGAWQLLCGAEQIDCGFI